MFNYLLSKYEISLKRDPGLIDYINKISKIYFNQELKSEGSVQSMIKEMFSDIVKESK